LNAATIQVELTMFRIHFLDVGHGDCTILQFENGRTYLIDGNETSGKVTPVEYLTQTLGITQLETVVATHPHNDHISGLVSLIEQIPVRQVWLTDFPLNSEIYRRLLSAMNRQPEIRVFFPRSGTRVSEGKDRVYILAPPSTLLRGTHADANNASIVLKATITNLEKNSSTHVILGADAEFDSWASIVLGHRFHLDAGLLKLSHHGSGFGTYKDVLAAIRPKYTVISVGTNIYGHPDEQVVSMVNEATRERVFRTDIDGTCIFESDGVEWQYID
jgi:competence protein ComEC